jgi:pimeloyl-ACP methyl ester carboxylesterase
VPQDFTSQDVDVAGGTLRVLSFGAGPRHALAVHGITASAMCWPAVARALPANWVLHAVDLRGRGHSTDLPSPYGLDAHIADLRDVVVALGLNRPVLVGHSLGAYVALLTAHAHPELFERLLLIDGGLPMSVPDDADVDEVLTATLGPAIARLNQTYPTADAYVQFWQAHPALADWNNDIDQYVRYDLRGEPGALRSRANPEAVRADSRELLTAHQRIGAALRGMPGPTTLLRAPAGMFGQPPGLLPEDLAAYWQAEAPALRVTTVPDSNHYTIICAPQAAAAVAERIATPRPS